MAALESSLARMLQDFQEDRRKLTAVFAAERAEAQADIRALRQLAKARGRALHKVRPPFPDGHGLHHESGRIRRLVLPAPPDPGVAYTFNATLGITPNLAGVSAAPACLILYVRPPPIHTRVCTKTSGCCELHRSGSWLRRCWHSALRWRCSW